MTKRIFINQQKHNVYVDLGRGLGSKCIAPFGTKGDPHAITEIELSEEQAAPFVTAGMLVSLEKFHKDRAHLNKQAARGESTNAPNEDDDADKKPEDPGKKEVESTEDPGEDSVEENKDAEEEVESTEDDLTSLDKVAEKLAAKLKAHGFDSYLKIAEAEKEKLLEVEGITKLNVNQIQQSAVLHVADAEDEE